MTPRKEEIVALIKWTITHYGSDAGDREIPGSKLQSQAEYIANALQAYEDGVEQLGDLLQYISISLRHT